MNLLEALEYTDNREADCCDKETNLIEVAWCLGCDDSIEDEYDRFIIDTARLIDVVEMKKYNGIHYATCDFSGFVRKNYDVFRIFCEKHNGILYQFSEDISDENNILIALTTLQNMIPGGYPETAYHSFNSLIVAFAENGV